MRKKKRPERARGRSKRRAERGNELACREGSEAWRKRWNWRSGSKERRRPCPLLAL